MPGGKFDSSKTRVVPVFDQVAKSGKDWIRHLLPLPQGGAALPSLTKLDLTPLETYWGRNEARLSPPVALLSWLIRNVPPPSRGRVYDDRRRSLLYKDPGMISCALEALRHDGTEKDWYIFEGPTQPDAFIVTPDALVVIEGKRAEPGPTTNTTWMDVRHQIWRHLDAAWEIRGRREVFGFFIVEDQAGLVPQVWEQAVADTLSDAAVNGSLPHRSERELLAMKRCFLGVTTWRLVCERFNLSAECLPNALDDLTAKKDATGLVPQS